MKSVYADPQYAGTVEALKAELVRLRKHYRDTDPELAPAKSPKKKKGKPKKAA